MIKYDFKCEICQGKFDSESNIPKVLQCGHTICSKCVERMKSKNMSRCPFDRKLIDPDDDKIAINYYILHLIDGSIKDTITEMEEKEEVFELKPKPVVNSPGWKNTLDGFIHGDILYTVESNGFIYCTDLNTGEWWFLYLNVFYGKFFFKNCNDINNFFPKMYMIDQYGNLFQMFNKNYYTQFGKKGSWKNTTFSTVFRNKMYSLETSDKLYETDLTTGEWREIALPVDEDEKNNSHNINLINNLRIINVNNLPSGQNRDNEVNGNLGEFLFQSSVPIVENMMPQNGLNFEVNNSNNNFDGDFEDNFEDEERINLIQGNIENDNIIEENNENPSSVNNHLDRISVRDNILNNNYTSEEQGNLNSIDSSQRNINSENTENFGSNNSNNNVAINNQNNSLNSNNFMDVENNFLNRVNQNLINTEIAHNQENESNLLIQNVNQNVNEENQTNINLNEENQINNNHNNNIIRNETAEIRQNRFLQIYDFYNRLGFSSSFNFGNGTNNNQSSNLFNDLNINNLNNTYRKMISNTPNIMTPIKFSKLLRDGIKENKKVRYNFAQATALFSTTENLFFTNKRGEIFKINEKTGEIKLESKNFSKNIDCFCFNSTHCFIYENESKIIYRASIIKNMPSEQDMKKSNCNKIEISKKVFSDKEDTMISNGNNSIKLENFNFSTAKMNNNKNFSIDFQMQNVNLTNNCLANRQSVINIEEMKNEEVLQNDIKTCDMLSNEIISKNKIFTMELNDNIKNNILLSNNCNIKLDEREKEKSDLLVNFSQNNFTHQGSNLISAQHLPKKISFDTDYLKLEKFYEVEASIIPTKLICDDKKLIIIDKNGELNKLDIETKKIKNFQCLFMLRNCHLNNSVLIGDGDLILLDPVRLSLNKLNIITGTEIIILHSVKFLSSIKFLFTNNSKIYFIDVSGNLYHFNEYDKKIIQIGNNGLCKYILDFGVHRNLLFTIENNSSLYRTNLNDGIYKEYKNEYVKNYSRFLSDNTVIIFITKDDFVHILIPNNDELVLKRKFKYENISKISAITLFKKQIIFYNTEKKTIESININEEEISSRVLVENFGEILSFINNNDCLACIIKDCVIYKLFC